MCDNKLARIKTREGCSSLLTNNGKHGNTSVLQFDPTKTVEFSLISSFKNVAWIPEAKRDLGTNFFLERCCRQSRSRLGGLGRGKCGSRSNKSGDNGNLHHG